MENNDWIKINNLNEMPKDYASLLWVYTDKGNIYNYCHYSSWFSISETENITHYKVIQKPKPPTS